MTANGYGISFWGDEYVLELRGGDQCTALWIYIQLYTLKKGTFGM